MINANKTTELTPNPQIAGVMPNDSNIEFIGIRETRTVLWLQNGCSRYFKDLPEKHYQLLNNAYKSDQTAVSFLSQITASEKRQVELYTYYMYGSIDNKPDISNLILSVSENFRDSQDCPSLKWESKRITIDDYELNARQIFIIDAISDDQPDKVIASMLGISQTTLDFHKKNLFEATGVHTKTALLKKAIQNKIIQ